MKFCKKCQQDKDFSEFAKCKTRKDGYNFYCKTCSSQMSKEHAIKNIEQKRKRSKQYYYDNLEKEHERGKKKYHRNKTQYLEKNKNYRRKNPEQRLLTSAKSRAKIKNLEFTIELKDIIIPEYCPILGIRLNLNNNRREDNSISLDRLNPTEGYVTGNIRVISWRANRIKNNITLDEFKQFVLYLENKI